MSGPEKGRVGRRGSPVARGSRSGRGFREPRDGHGRRQQHHEGEGDAQVHGLDASIFPSLPAACGRGLD